MGIIAIILGIISLIVGCIPIWFILAFMPAVVGLVVGIVDIIQKNKKGEKKGLSIVGIILSTLAIVIATLHFFSFPALLMYGENEVVSETSKTIEQNEYLEENDRKALEKLEQKLNEERQQFNLDEDDEDYDEDDDEDDDDYDYEDDEDYDED